MLGSNLFEGIWSRKETWRRGCVSAGGAVEGVVEMRVDDVDEGERGREGAEPA